jgi:cytochrome c oxidase cbb3-type subunit 3
MVDEGKALFHGEGRCVRCHGKDGKGTSRGPDLTSRRWVDIHGEYDENVAVVTNGIAKPKEHPIPMPPKGGSKISSEQIREVAAYVWSISH